MPDYGQPGSYLTLDEGTPVVTSDGAEIGTVTHVLAVTEEDIFDGIVVDTGDGHRFVDAPFVEEIFERAVVLTISEADAAALPEPAANPAAMALDADDTVPDTMRDKLHRAWNLISGNY